MGRKKSIKYFLTVFLVFIVGVSGQLEVLAETYQSGTNDSTTISSSSNNESDIAESSNLQSSSVEETVTSTSKTETSDSSASISNETTSSSEVQTSSNDNDIYFPKNPSDDDVEGDNIKPYDSGIVAKSNSGISAFSRSAAGSIMNQEIIENYESGKYKTASIVKTWREYQLFRYRNLTDTEDQSTPNGIVVHETANKNSSIWSEINYMDQHWDNAFVHAFVDSGNIIEIHDPTYAAWGAGRVANKYFLHVELVEHANRTDFMKAILNDAYYMAVKLDQFGLTPSRPSGQANDNTGTIWSHKEISLYLGGTNHVDPDGYFQTYGYTMNDYFQLIQYMYNKVSTPPVIEKTSIENINNSTQTFSVRVKASATSGIKEIKVPVWTETDQSDIYWYVAKLQSDGTYIATIDPANHNRSNKKYTIHAYATANNGKSEGSVVGNVVFKGPDITDVVIINKTSNSFDVQYRVSTENSASLTSLKTTVYTSDSKYKKSYDAKDLGNGVYQSTIYAKDFNYTENQLLYTIQVTNNLNETSSKEGEAGAFSFQPKVTNTTIDLLNSKPEYEATLSLENDEPVDSVYFPVWSETNGQDDIKWYQAKFNNQTNSWTATIPIYNHNDTGKYNIHFYVKNKSGRMILVKTNTFTVAKQTKISMFRLYNSHSGEHFFTKDLKEKNSLIKVGWKDEGIAWYAPSKGDPVYRLYNKNTGDHHYTMSKNENDHLVKVGWKSEGIGWYSDSSKQIALYRLYNPNSRTATHHYTKDSGERDSLVKVGWKSEGIGWYGLN